MAENQFNEAVGHFETPMLDPMAKAVVYRLRRDALMIVSSLHRGRDLPSMHEMKQHLVFVQGQLCRAALADPRLSQPAKDAMIAFHGTTVHENIAARRGSRRRHDCTTEKCTE